MSGGVRGRKFLDQRNFLLLDCRKVPATEKIPERAVSENPCPLRLWKFHLNGNCQSEARSAGLLSDSFFNSLFNTVIHQQFSKNCHGYYLLYLFQIISVQKFSCENIQQRLQLH